MKYTWSCNICNKSGEHSLESTNPHKAGFEIYGTHSSMSPDCKCGQLEIIEGEAQTFFHSRSFQSELQRVLTLGGQAVLVDQTLTLYRGCMPQSTIKALSNLLKRLDVSNFIEIRISDEDYPPSC